MARRKKSSGWDFVERLNNVVEEKLDELAKTVQIEMQTLVVNHGTTTHRERLITIDKQSEHSRFVGSTDLGLYYLDQGNGGSGATITPRVKKAMAFNWKGAYWVRTQVHGYDGIHFVRTVADRHR